MGGNQKRSHNCLHVSCVYVQLLKFCSDVDNVCIIIDNIMSYLTFYVILYAYIYVYKWPVYNKSNINISTMFAKK